jgi:hypothetical protein
VPTNGLSAACVPQKELKQRLAFTLGALLVYRLGAHVPLPGIGPSVWARMLHAQADAIFRQWILLLGGGIHRLAIFARNISRNIDRLCSSTDLSWRHVALAPGLRNVGHCWACPGRRAAQAERAREALSIA